MPVRLRKRLCLKIYIYRTIHIDHLFRDTLILLHSSWVTLPLYLHGNRVAHNRSHIHPIGNQSLPGHKRVFQLVWSKNPEFPCFDKPISCRWCNWKWKVLKIHLFFFFPPQNQVMTISQQCYSVRQYALNKENFIEQEWCKDEILNMYAYSWEPPGIILQYINVVLLRLRTFFFLKKSFILFSNIICKQALA